MPSTLYSSDAASTGKCDNRQHIIDAKDVDIGALVVNGDISAVDPTEAARVRYRHMFLLCGSLSLSLGCRKKTDMYLLPLMCTLYWYAVDAGPLGIVLIFSRYGVQFMDKVTLGSSAIMGIVESNNLTTNQFNWLGTVFYVGYLAFEFPQNLCLQRFPVGKWLSFNIFVWAIALCCHAACKDFYGLLIVRLLLGACEGCITAGFLITSSMFYTRAEQIERVGYWYASIGFSEILSSFIGYGILHIKNSALEPWQWLMIITGLITLVCAVVFWFKFPDSPATAWFLAPSERIIAVKRIQAEQTGVENKRFKREQFFEAIKDPKMWLFSLYSALTLVSGSVANQRWMIVSSFGFTPIQNVLLGCVDGVLTMGLTIGASVTASRLPNARAYVSAAYYAPALLGILLLNVLSWDNKVGLLFSYWLITPAISSYVVALSWAASVTAGHTKKGVMNAFILSAYCVGYAAGQFIWQHKYLPRNHVPWIILAACFGACIVILLSIRYLLLSENKRRDERHSHSDASIDEFYVKTSKNDGTKQLLRVDKAFLDLTDLQNEDFRYVL